MTGGEKTTNQREMRDLGCTVGGLGGKVFGHY
jgi:hypothetical protein